ncbi:MAG: pyroglutamyl-peptidase I [Rhizobiales bacterium]|nr:pyroglutamyl-peptidase I [Hyphomicrobiales bacterium]
MTTGRSPPARGRQQVEALRLSDRPLRILVTGFGPFPGAPRNPTQALVTALTRLRRPALADVTVIGHVFEVSYSAVDRELPELLSRHQPHALLMFGLAARTPHLRIETRARNTITTRWPDRDGRYNRLGAIVAGVGTMAFGSHTSRLLRAVQTSGVDAKLSRDAGSYLCNYLCWRALEAARDGSGPRLAAFIHVPPVAPGPATAGELARAGEALLLQMAALAKVSPARRK